MEKQRIYNFSAGPGTLPESVLQEAQDEMLQYKSAGASVIEISHHLESGYTVTSAQQNKVACKIYVSKVGKG